MKKALIIFFIFSLRFCTYSQNISQQVIGSCGTHINSNGYRINYTVGETVIATFENLNYILGQGFHQYSLLATSVDDIELFQKFLIYPNPATKNVNIRVLSAEDTGIHHVKILDTNGRILLSSEFNPRVDISASLNTENLTCGFYLIQVVDEKGRNANYKFIKI
jgi:hypothetical protein